MLVLVFLLYNIWQSMKKDNIVLENNIIKKAPITSAIIPPGPQKLTQISQRPIIGLVIADEKLKYFDQANGNLYEMALDGTREREIIQSKISGLLGVYWNQDRTKAIIKTQEKNYFYDFATNQVLIIDLENPTWCQDKVFYVCSQGICQSDGDGFKQEVVLQTAMRDLKLVCDNQNLYVYQKPSAKAPSNVYLLAKKQITKIMGPNYGLIFKAPDNYSVGIEPYNTIADKCIQNYCAVPQNLPSNALMPDDYYKNLIATQDSFWDVQNKKEIIKTPYDAKNLMLFEDKLYFQDKTTNYLYMIRL